MSRTSMSGLFQWIRGMRKQLPLDVLFTILKNVLSKNKWSNLRRGKYKKRYAKRKKKHFPVGKNRRNTKRKPKGGKKGTKKRSHFKNGLPIMGPKKNKLPDYYDNRSWAEKQYDIFGNIIRKGMRRGPHGND